MPEKSTLKRAAADRRAGKSASTQAGEFVRQEMHHIREGKHGAKSAKQAIAIGLSEARRAGVALEPPKKGKAKEKTRKSAERAYRAGRRHTKKKASARRSRAMEGVLRRESHAAASHRALSRQAHRAAQGRSRSSRSAAARKAARTKGFAERSLAARKAARTRAANRRASHRA